MQLTKDDIETDTHIKDNYDEFGKSKQYIDVPKFQKVRKFYETYRGKCYKLEREHKSIYRIYLKFMKDETKDFGWRDTCDYYSDYVVYNDWLFNYCFKDGLK